jgi:putative transposase
MQNSNDIRRGRHCVFKMHVHLVFVTKFRREVFTKEILEDLRNLFVGVCKDFEAELVEFDGEDHHVHLLVNYHPKVAISTLVNSRKGVSSRMIRQKKYPRSALCIPALNGGVFRAILIIAQTNTLADERNNIDIQRRRMDASVLLVKPRPAVGTCRSCFRTPDHEYYDARGERNRLCCT